MTIFQNLTSASLVPPVSPADISLQEIIPALTVKQQAHDNFVKSTSIGDIVIWKYPGKQHHAYVKHNVYIDSKLAQAYGFHKFIVLKTSGTNLAPGFWHVKELQSGTTLFLNAHEFISGTEDIPKNKKILKMIDKIIPDCRLVCPNLCEFLSEIKTQISDKAPFTKERFDKIKLQLKPFIIELKKQEEDDESDYVLEKLKSLFADMSKVVVANPAEKAVK